MLGDNLLSLRDLQLLFSDIQLILPLNKELLQRLQAVDVSSESDPALGNVFIALVRLPILTFTAASVSVCQLDVRVKARTSSSLEAFLHFAFFRDFFSIDVGRYVPCRSSHSSSFLLLPGTHVQALHAIHQQLRRDHEDPPATPEE